MKKNAGHRNRICPLGSNEATDTLEEVAREAGYIAPEGWLLCITQTLRGPVRYLAAYQRQRYSGTPTFWRFIGDTAGEVTATFREKKFPSFEEWSCDDEDGQ